ncbi:hypothetical protein GCM10022252_76200 [Streptosporangium oxazolinicum]|uniref:Uncharacterized protein n=1 Tax=Streptosporangium oxazolinicum TaxID=909287 RepID=A0ABP8BL75_9ACTN
MTAINDRYVLVQGDTHMYYLPETGTSRHARSKRKVYAPGDIPMTELNKPGWWASTGPAPEITIHIPQWDRTTSYTLRDPATASEKFPPTLTPEEFETAAAGSLDTETIHYNLYKPVTEPVADVITTISTTGWPVLTDAVPDVFGERPWHASLPSVLTQRPEYLHLFPGYLDGLRDHLKNVIKALPGVQYCYVKDNHLDVTIQVPLDLPRTQWVTPPNQYGPSRRKPKPVERPVLVTRHLRLPVPDRVPGPNQEAAIHAWDRAVAHWVAVVTDAKAAACHHCDGTGHVPLGSTEYTPTKP